MRKRVVLRSPVRDAVNKTVSEPQAEQASAEGHLACSVQRI
jgi:hypothetical protein